MKLAWKEITYYKVRYAFVFAIVFLLSFLVYMISGLASGLSFDNASVIKTLPVNGYYLSEDSEDRLDRSLLTWDDFEKISQNKDISKAYPIAFEMSSLQSIKDEKRLDAAMMSVDTALLKELGFGQLKNDEVIIDESLAEDGALKIGDKIKNRRDNKTYQIVGITSDKRYSHSPVVFKEINKNEPIQSIAVSLKENTDGKNIGKISFLTEKDVLNGLPSYSSEQKSLYMMIGFLVVISAVVIGVFFYVFTLQKINQFGILKAIGMQSGELASTVLIQMLIVVVTAMASAFVIVSGISSVMPSAAPFLFEYKMALLFSAILLIMSVLSSLLSLYQVLKVDALEAIGGTK